MYWSSPKREIRLDTRQRQNMWKRCVSRAHLEGLSHVNQFKVTEIEKISEKRLKLFLFALFLVTSPTQSKNGALQRRPQLARTPQADILPRLGGRPCPGTLTPLCWEAPRSQTPGKSSIPTTCRPEKEAVIFVQVKAQTSVSWVRDCNSDQTQLQFSFPKEWLRSNILLIYQHKSLNSQVTLF